MKLSKTEQDYIKAIYEFQMAKPKELVSLKQLVDHMQVSAPTVTEMVKRIEKKELIIYKSYKGVTLTEYGLKEAVFILKAHRVWEYFLLDVLKYQEEDVHIEAEALEHAATPQLIERLYAFLGKPETCPHGQRIPQMVFWYEDKRIIPLVELPIGVRAEIAELSPIFTDFLTLINTNSTPTFIKVMEILEDGTSIAEVDDGEQIVLPAFFQKDVTVIVYEQKGGATDE